VEDDEEDVDDSDDEEDEAADLDEGECWKACRVFVLILCVVLLWVVVAVVSAGQASAGGLHGTHKLSLASCSLLFLV
jgi:hypothetical protein